MEEFSLSPGTLSTLKQFYQVAGAILLIYLKLLDIFGLHCTRSSKMILLSKSHTRC